MKVLKSEFAKRLFAIIKPIVFAAAIALFLLCFVIVSAVVPTASMEPTILCNDRVIFSRMAYWFSAPRRGDIVVFRFPDNESVLFVKRVAGLPGETVEIKNGQVYIDGIANAELDAYGSLIQGNFGPYQVPPQSYFMLGDNRNNSLDSRYWSNPYVARKDILGRAWFQYWPKLELY